MQQDRDGLDGLADIQLVWHFGPDHLFMSENNLLDYTTCGSFSTSHRETVPC